MGSNSRIPARQTVSVVCALCASELIGGVYFGFASFVAHLTFWMLAGMLLVAAFYISERLWPVSALADTVVRTGLVVFALVVLFGLVLGATNLLAPVPYLIGEAVLLLAIVRGLPRRGASVGGRVSLSPLVVAVMMAMAAFVLGMGLSHSPFTAYDSLSYHLFFPARWLQAHQISIISTPFSDEAQAYQPANGELWFLWLMVPFHGDFLARIGQFPFYLIAGATAYALARRMGATASHAIYAPALLFIAPPVIDQAIGANVDLIFASMFLASLYLGIVAVDTNRPRDWALWGIGVGLFLGTKYLALVYLPVFLILPFMRGLRVRALWALPGIAVFGLTWYVRNWLVAGSPIYPASLTVAGLTIGQGAYTHAAMLQSFLHTTDPRLLGVSLIHAFGPPFFLFALPVAALVVAALIRRSAWRPAAFVAFTCVAVVLLVWLGLGDNADSRFLLTAVVTATSLLPLAFVAIRRINAGVHGLFALGIVWILVGADTQLRASVPWYMGDWLLLHGVVSRQFLAYFALLAVAAAVGWRMASPRGWAIPVMVALVGAAGVALAIGAETWCVPSRCDFLQVTSPLLRLNYLYGSRWLGANVGPATVAYSGINLPYPLCGSHLAHVVHYVNIDDHVDWRFDQYARAFRAGPSGQADAAALASGSGILMPMTEREGTFDALRPRFERMSGNRASWIANLKTRKVDYVFVSTLDSYEINHVWHNAQGFPIEDEWAKADPTAFRLAYENPDVRIYQVTAS